MTVTDSPFAYDDIKSLLDRALSSTKGVKTICASHGQAVRLRQRCNKFRAMDRRENRKIYEPDHPLHGRSSFDCLIFRLEPGSCELVIEKITGDRLNVIEL
jgi:hypothetical protein